ncbi:MAG: sulfatase-like hydrolase/transferase, partial [Prolixibacteraceae bacterium]|nr:sulfatase-like hydrolase/transferase [Prolixibacteraceae bacterium]
MRSLIYVAAIIFTLQLAGCSGNESEQNQQPNILFAISDDQSFAHTSFNGCKFINTPAFDRVAGEGICFSACMAGSPGCA